METDWNAQGLFTAQVFHIRLNQAGIAEAERMTDRLKDIKFSAVFSSDQIRAIETATIICSVHPEVKSFITDLRLREVNVGSLMGTVMSEVTDPTLKTRHPQFDFRPVGGESRSDVISRLCSFLGQIKATYRNADEVLVVGHGTALRVMLEEFHIPEVLTRENFVRIDIDTFFSFRR